MPPSPPAASVGGLSFIHHPIRRITPTSNKLTTFLDLIRHSNRRFFRHLSVILALQGDPDADDDADGLAALFEHALGTSDQIPGLAPISLGFPVAGEIQLSFPRNLAADDATIEIQLSDDLVAWESAGASAVMTDSVWDGSGVRLETWTITESAAPRRFARLLVRQR